jgi:hypothetical protein
VARRPTTRVLLQSRAARASQWTFGRLLRVLCTAAALTTPAAAQSVSDFVPATAANCTISAPPATAGLFGTPGGFVMVHPRNDALTDSYTGCKALWVVDVDRMLRLATLYFENGAIARAIAHDVRDPKGAIEAACDLKTGRSLLPNAGRRATDAACTGFQGEELYGLRVPTWPRRCLTEPDAAVCKQAPR